MQNTILNIESFSNEIYFGTYKHSITYYFINFENYKKFKSLENLPNYNNYIFSLFV